MTKIVMRKVRSGQTNTHTCCQELVVDTAASLANNTPYMFRERIPFTPITELRHAVAITINRSEVEIKQVEDW
jgi:hypothetical protein